MICLNVLIRNFKSLKMWCSSKKKPKCFPLLFKTKPQFELFVFPVSSILLCLLDESESLPAWRLSCESAPSLSLCVSVSLTKSFCLVYWTAQKTSHGEGMRNTLQKSVREFDKGFGHWIRLIPKTFLSRTLCSVFVVDIHFMRLLSTCIFAVFSKWLLEYSCIVLGWSMEEDII